MHTFGKNINQSKSKLSVNINEFNILLLNCISTISEHLPKFVLGKVLGRLLEKAVEAVGHFITS